MKKIISLIAFLLLLSLWTFGQQIDRVYKVNGVWKGDISGPITTYPSNGVVISDTSSIPDPVVIPPVVFTSVDNVDPKMIYTGGGWFSGPTNATGFYPAAPNSTLAYASAAGNVATLNFTGTSIEVFCEKKSAVGHGSATFQVDAQTPTTVNLNATGGVVSAFKVENLTNTQHTFKLTVVGGGNVVFDYVKINGSAVSPPIPPTGDIIVPPGQSVKSAVESAASGKTVQLLAGVYNENTINVPLGVNIVGAGKGQTFIDFTGTHAQQSETAIMQLKSSSQVNGNQTLSGFTIRGKFLGNGGIIVDKRDNVIITDVKIQETTYFGGWLKNTGTEWSNSEFLNTSWASVGWVTGELNVQNITNTLIHHNLFTTTRTDKGYGIKALWSNGTVRTSKIYSNKFQLVKTSIWNNGSAPNIDLELHDTYYAGIEIYDNDFGTVLSLASHRPTTSGITKVTGNRFTWSSTCHIELVCSDILIEGNTFSGAPMMTANFQPNGKWVNQTINNNDFISNNANPSWGGVFLVGADGANMIITNNRITYQPYTFVKHMGSTANSTIVDTGNIKN